jgi:hypothetical protein
MLKGQRVDVDFLNGSNLDHHTIPVRFTVDVDIKSSLALLRSAIEAEKGVLH